MEISGVVLSDAEAGGGLTPHLRSPMKTILAVIQPTKLKAVREALEKIEVTRMTVCDAQGFGRQRGQSGCGGC